MIAGDCRDLGSEVALLPCDLADPPASSRLVADAVERLGTLTALVMSHCDSVDSSLLTTTIESWDRGVAETLAGRLGTPEDTANLVRFLLSDQGAWINGQVLYRNGGFRTG